MKRPQPDLKEKILSEFISKKGKLARFKRLWGTTMLNGEEVFVYGRAEHRIDKDRTKATDDLLRWLGAYNEVKNARWKGVERAWLYLNYNKDGLPNFSKEILSNNLTKAVQDSPKVWLTIGPKIKYSGLGNYGAPAEAPPLNPVLDEDNYNVADIDAFITEVRGVYDTLWDNDYLLKGTGEDRYKNLLAKYLLRKNQTDVLFTPIKAYKTVKSMSIAYHYRKYNYNTEEYETVVIHKAEPLDVFVIEFDVDASSIDIEDSLVQYILEDGASGVYSTIYNNKDTGNTLLSGFFDDDYEPVGITYNSDLWVLESNGVYLKTSAIGPDSPLSLDSQIALVFGCIDQDYEEEEAEWWEKIVVIVVVIIAIVLSPWSGGTSLYAVSVAITTAVVYVSIALTLLAMIANEMGNYSLGSAASKLNKQIAPLVQIASLYLVITGLYTQGQNIYSAGGGTASGMAQEVVDMAINAVTDMSFNSAVRITNMVVNKLQQMDMDDLQRKIKREESRIAEYAETKEQAETRHLWMEMIKSEPNLTAKDNSIYAQLYDRPYEWWSSDYHTGNIQNTTVSALWTKPD